MNRGCLGCLVDGRDHTCGFVAAGSPRTSWNRTAQTPKPRVHDHPPYRPVCNERRLSDGQLRGACLNDDGSSASETRGGGQ